jgi:hypothetical protein
LISGGVLILSFYADFEHLPWFELFLLFWAFPNSSLPFCLALPLFIPFAGFCSFPSSRWSSWAFLGSLGLLAVLYGVLDLNFKFCAFVVNGLIKGRLRNQVVSSLVWLWWIINLARFEFESGIVHFIFLLSLFRLENRVCLSHGVQETGAAWRAATRIMVGVGDLVQRTRDGRTG